MKGRRALEKIGIIVIIILALVFLCVSYIFAKSVMARTEVIRTFYVYEAEENGVFHLRDCNDLEESWKKQREFAEINIITGFNIKQAIEEHKIPCDTCNPDIKYEMHDRGGNLYGRILFGMLE